MVGQSMTIRLRKVANHMVRFAAVGVKLLKFGVRVITSMFRARCIVMVLL